MVLLKVLALAFEHPPAGWKLVVHQNRHAFAMQPANRMHSAEIVKQPASKGPMPHIHFPEQQLTVTPRRNCYRGTNITMPRGVSPCSLWFASPGSRGPKAKSRLIYNEGLLAISGGRCSRISHQTGC